VIRYSLSFKDRSKRNFLWANINVSEEYEMQMELTFSLVIDPPSASCLRIPLALSFCFRYSGNSLRETFCSDSFSSVGLASRVSSLGFSVTDQKLVNFSQKDLEAISEYEGNQSYWTGHLWVLQNNKLHHLAHRSRYQFLHFLIWQ